MPSETFTHSAVAAAPTAEVWVALQRPETWEAIGGIDRVVDASIDTEGRLQGFSFDTMIAGQAYRGEATAAGRDEGRLMAWKIENSEISGEITVVLTPVDLDTEIEVTLSVESKGLLAGMFFSVVSMSLGNGLPRSVNDFASAFAPEG